MFSVGSIVAFAAGLVVVAVLHELGHLAAARVLNIPVKRIGIGLGPVLWRRWLGDDLELVLRAVPAGVTVGVPGRRDTDGCLRRPVGHDMLLAAAGPLASLLTALALWAAAWIPGLPLGLSMWLVSTAGLSALLGVLNLIPIPGLDGGHLALLTLARLGYSLSPQREAAAHHLGLRLLAVALVVLLAAEIAWIL